VLSVFYHLHYVYGRAKSDGTSSPNYGIGPSFCSNFSASSVWASFFFRRRTASLENRHHTSNFFNNNNYCKQNTNTNITACYGGGSGGRIKYMVE
jgi:hypothetical protein